MCSIGKELLGCERWGGRSGWEEIVRRGGIGMCAAVTIGAGEEGAGGSGSKDVMQELGEDSGSDIGMLSSFRNEDLMSTRTGRWW